MTVPATIDVDRDKAFEWIMKGAQPTDTARAILKFKGVYYRKHLQRGVLKGALTEEKAAEMYQEWIDTKEAKIAARIEDTKRKKEEFYKMLSGEIKPRKKPAAKEAGDAFREGDAAAAAPEGDAAAPETPAAEATAAEAPAKEEAPATAEAPAKEEPKAEAPAADAAKVAAAAAAPVAAEVVKEEPPKEEAPKAEAPKEESPAAEAKPDDLTKIEGIGPAISKALAASGIITFSDLAAKSADDVKEVLAGAGGNLSMHDPTTWGKQADMAAKGEWDALKKWQDELDGGKEVSASSSEEE